MSRTAIPPSPQEVFRKLSIHSTPKHTPKVRDLIPLGTLVNLV